MAYNTFVRFDWDEEKNEWADPTSVEFFDPEHNADEDRFIRVGHSTSDKVLLVVFCEKDNGELIRIISARKATSKERRQYEEGI